MNVLLRELENLDDGVRFLTDNKNKNIFRGTNDMKLCGTMIAYALKKHGT